MKRVLCPDCIRYEECDTRKEFDNIIKCDSYRGRLFSGVERFIKKYLIKL